MQNPVLNYLTKAFFLSFLFTACGSFQTSRYYSDGIYSDQDVVIIRKDKKQNNSSAYSQYFDEQAQQYQWEDDEAEDVALTQLDQINNNDISSYQTQPNWGGGNTTTQIIFQTDPWNYGYGGFWNNWNVFDFYGPSWSYWNRPFMNRGLWRNPYWNRFAWGGFYHPSYGPGFPFHLDWRFSGMNPYFYGYGNFYAFNNRFRNRSERGGNGYRRPSQALSSSYRGEAPAGGTRRSVAAANQDRNATTEEQTNVAANRRSRIQRDVPDLVAEGRRANQNRNTQAASAEQVQRRTRFQEQQNRSTIERLINDLQRGGYNVDVLTRQERNRIDNQNAYPSNSGNGNTNGRTQQYSSGSKKAPSTRRANTNSNNTRSSSTRSNQSNQRRSYSQPSQPSFSSGSRSSGGRSSGSSGGRSSSGGGGRRQ